MMTPARRSSLPILLILAALLLLFSASDAGAASVRHLLMDSSGDSDAKGWRSLGDVSCMDYGGNNEETHRGVDSLHECERKCDDHGDNCNAVTYNRKSKNCYLKMTCYDQEKRENGDESSQLKDVKFCWGKNGNDPKVFGVAHDHVCCVASPPGGRNWECCKEDYDCDGTCYKLTTKDDYQKGEPAC